MRRTLLFAAILSLFGIAPLMRGEQRALAVGFAVDTTADTVDASPGDGVCADASGDCSLRAAIMEANALAGADVITLPAGTYVITIDSPGDEDTDDRVGDFEITSEITITGAGSATTTIDGNQIARIFQLANRDRDGNTTTDPVRLFLSGVTLQNGNTPSTFWGNGGAITTFPTVPLPDLQLSLEDVVVQDNTARNGAGIHSSVPTSMTDVVVRRNKATGVGTVLASGGGIWLSGGSSALVRVDVYENGE